MKRTAGLLAIGAAGVLLWFGLEAAERGSWSASARAERADEALAPPATLVPAESPSEPELEAVAARAKGERLSVTEARGARILRGRAVEATTGQPLGLDFSLDLRSADGRTKERVALDPDGWFESTRAYGPGQVLAGLYEHHEGLILVSHRFESDPENQELVLRLTVGLLVHLDLAIPKDVTPTSARARVVVTTRDGTVAWSWDSMRPMRNACLHDSRPGEATAAVVEAWLEVELEADPDTLRGRVPLAAMRGVLGPIPVPLQWDARADGRVVDAAGKPLDDVTVVLLAEAEEAPRGDGTPRAKSAVDGRFEVKELAPGPYRLSFQRGLATAPSRRVILKGGRNDLGDLRLDVPAADGFVRGRVAHDGEGLPFVTLVLTDLRSGEEWFALTSFALFGPGETGAFAFEAVPPGLYELRPTGLGMTFVPERARVSPPVAGLDFDVDPESPPYVVVIEARDARSGELLSELDFLIRPAGLWLGGRGLECGQPVPAIGDRAVLWAEGYRPVLVDRPSPTRFEPVEINGERARLATIPIELERGWTTGVIAIDGDHPRSALSGDFEPYFGPRLAGVEVSAGGRKLATTDTEGLALLSGDADPGPLDFHLPGWRVLTVTRQGQVFLVVFGRG